MAESYEQAFQVPADQLFAIASQVIEQNWKLQASDPQTRSISYKTGLSMKSWVGQDMVVTVEPLDAARSKLVVAGQKRPTFQLFDWNEKKSLSNKLFKKVAEALG